MNIKNVIDNSSITKIMQHARFLAQLNQQLQQLFPPHFQQQFRIANIQANQLCLEVKSATVRQALLFRQRELLKLVQQDYPNINQLSIRINPIF